jgi:transposase-like protein
MAKRKRRRLNGAEKAEILKRHLVGGEDVSALCDEYKIHPTSFYEWQRIFFEQGAKAFEKENKQDDQHLQAKIDQLEAKLQRKEHVLSELMEDHVALKKSLGEP